MPLRGNHCSYHPMIHLSQQSQRRTPGQPSNRPAQTVLSTPAQKVCLTTRCSATTAALSQQAQSLSTGGFLMDRHTEKTHQFGWEDPQTIFFKRKFKVHGDDFFLGDILTGKHVILPFFSHEIYKWGFLEWHFPEKPVQWVVNSTDPWNTRMIFKSSGFPSTSIQSYHFRVEPETHRKRIACVSRAAMPGGCSVALPADWRCCWAHLWSKWTPYRPAGSTNGSHQWEPPSPKIDNFYQFFWVVFEALDMAGLWHCFHLAPKSWDVTKKHRLNIKILQQTY